jgi:hypothetical protein
MDIKHSKNLGIIFIILGFVLLIVASGLALREYFFYKPELESVSGVQSLLSFMSSELLVLIVKVAFLGVIIAASSVMLRYGLELTKESRK